jgi:hypothetical protein
MSAMPENLRSVDWSRTTFAGARREQLRRWAEVPLDRLIASLEEMEEIVDQLGGHGGEPSRDEAPNA